MLCFLRTRLRYRGHLGVGGTVASPEPDLKDDSLASLPAYSPLPIHQDVHKLYHKYLPPSTKLFQSPWLGWTLPGEPRASPYASSFLTCSSDTLLQQECDESKQSLRTPPHAYDLPPNQSTLGLEHSGDTLRQTVSLG